jgi:hypothetical protein
MGRTAWVPSVRVDIPFLCFSVAVAASRRRRALPGNRPSSQAAWLMIITEASRPTVNQGLHKLQQLFTGLTCTKSNAKICKQGYVFDTARPVPDRQTGGVESALGKKKLVSAEG